MGKKFHITEKRGRRVPTATFFNLPYEKWEKIMRSARAEFARVPFSEASINRIVRAAEISRGSFYMYFKDKKDLFLCLLGFYELAVEKLVCLLLERRQGDCFAAMLDLFDCSQNQNPEVEDSDDIREFLTILQLNHWLHAELLFRGGIDAGHCIDRILGKVDTRRLDLREEEDLGEMMGLLARMTVSAIASGSATDDPAAVRRRLANQFEILKRGMSAKTACR